MVRSCFLTPSQLGTVDMIGTGAEDSAHEGLNLNFKLLATKFLSTWNIARQQQRFSLIAYHNIVHLII